VAVVATLSKGYDLEYIWKQVDCGPAKDAASYYIQASEAGGEPPGRWWGLGAKTLGFERGQRIEREPYDLPTSNSTGVIRSCVIAGSSGSRSGTGPGGSPRRRSAGRRRPPAA
jgi:hypothetical protein